MFDSRLHNSGYFKNRDGSIQNPFEVLLDVVIFGIISLFILNLSLFQKLSMMVEHHII